MNRRSASGTARGALRKKANPEGGFAFVFMDEMMSVMDGLTATRKIKVLERAAAKELPIIAMTANALQDDIACRVEAGVDAHLVKPLNFEKLKQTIHQFARKS